MPAQHHSALKLWKSAFCPASGFHLPCHFRSFNGEASKEIFFTARWGQMWGSHLGINPVGSQKDFAGLAVSVFLIPNGCETLWSTPCLPLYPSRSWEAGVDGSKHCDYEGLYTPVSQTSRWTCFSCCQKGLFIQGINSEVKGILWEFGWICLIQVYPFSPSWNL